MDYSYQEMLKMQEEAARRVQDMKSRAKKFVTDDNEQTDTVKTVEHTGVYGVPDKVKVISMPVEPLSSGIHRELRDMNKQNPPSEAADDEKDSFINSDSALILSLCMLLQAEKADEGLIMALMYLLV